MRFQLRGHLIEDRPHYDDYIIPLFNKEVMFPIFDRMAGIVFNKNKNFYGISLESPRIENEFNSLGIPSGVKGELFIPGWIKEDEEYTIRFLRGFLDTDGCVSCQRNYSIKNNTHHTQIRIYLSCTSKNLMEEIYYLLKELGFKCLISKDKKRGNWKTLYKVKISGGIETNKWFEKIGSKNPKHFTKYLVWKEFGFCPPYTTLDERIKILKKGVPPYNYYRRECQSGQMGVVKADVA